NSCTMKGVLRISSTYALAAPFSHIGPCRRAQAQAMPRPTPSVAATTVSAIVTPTPRASSGHSASTAEKSRLTMTGRCGVRRLLRQVAGRAAQPFHRHLVEVAGRFGGGDDLVDLQAQLVFALGHTDEVGRVLQQ